MEKINVDSTHRSQVSDFSGRDRFHARKALWLNETNSTDTHVPPWKARQFVFSTYLVLHVCCRLVRSRFSAPLPHPPRPIPPRLCSTGGAWDRRATSFDQQCFLCRFECATWCRFSSTSSEAAICSPNSVSLVVLERKTQQKSSSLIVTREAAAFM